MDIAIAVVLLLVAGIVAVFDRYSIQRTYTDVYAARHGHVPPLANWFLHADPDAEIEYWRRLHRNLWILVAGLGILAILILFARPSPG